MKKTACILIALMMIFASAAAALAADVSASYKNGTLTVSTSSGGYWTINVDGAGTERALSPGSPTLSFSYPLEDGEHRVGIHNDVHGGGSTTIYIRNGVSVEDYVAPTAAPTSKPTAKPTEKPDTAPTADPSAAVTEEPAPTIAPAPDPDHTTHTPVAIPGVEATCTKDGLTEGYRCAEGGEILTPQQVIPALGHRYRVESSSKSNVTYRCVRCDKVLKASPNEQVANRYGNIVKDLNGAVLTYQAAPAKNDEKTIALKLDKAADAAVLTLDNSLIPQIIREGYNKIEIVKGDFDAVVELNKISSAWFSVKGAIENYAFTLVKNGECKVEAKIAGSLVAADTFDGVTVK